MKCRPLPVSGRGALVAAAFLLLLVFAPATRACAKQAAVNPFTYLGRVMDASHAAFDTSRVATLSAYDADGTLLARIGTFFLPDSRRNYRLRVPLADAATKGYSKSGAVLSVSVEDGAGKTWTGDVVDLSPGAAQRDPQNTVSGQCCWTFSGRRRDAPPSAFFCVGVKAKLDSCS